MRLVCSCSRFHRPIHATPAAAAQALIYGQNKQVAEAVAAAAAAAAAGASPAAAATATATTTAATAAVTLLPLLLLLLLPLLPLLLTFLLLLRLQSLLLQLQSCIFMFKQLMQVMNVKFVALVASCCCIRIDTARDAMVSLAQRSAQDSVGEGSCI